MYRTLQFERQDRVAVLTLNLPEKRNPMTVEMGEEFRAAVAEIGQMEDIGALVLAANGPSFSSGGDLRMLEESLEKTPEENRRSIGAFYHNFLSILHLDVPTIAAIGGAAIGAGLSITLGCDIRIAAEEAKMGAVFLNLGLHPGMATTHLLPLMVGSARAAELLLTGRLITGREAAEIGLVNRAVPAEEVLAEAHRVAREIASKPASAVRMTKRALARPKLEGLEAALDYELSAQMSSFASAEVRQALTNLRKR